MAQRICQVCVKAFAPYQCPRCATVYCSVKCYQSHGESCTESFYKKQVEERLAEKGTGTLQDDQDAVNVARILSRNMANDPPELVVSGPEDHIDQLAKRIRDSLGLSEEELVGEHHLDQLDVHTLESCLDANQRKRFHMLARAGRLNHVVGIKPWTPWWHASVDVYLQKRKEALRPPRVTQLDEETTDTPPSSVEKWTSPSVWFGPGTVQSRKSLLTHVQTATLKSIRAPSVVPDAVFLHVCSVLLAYVYTQHEFQGCWVTDKGVAGEAQERILSRSSILCDARFRPQSMEDVLIDLVSRVPRNELAMRETQPSPSLLNVRDQAPKEQVEKTYCMLELKQLFRHPRVMVVDALLDVHFLFQTSPKGKKKVLQKLWFFVVWIYTMELFALQRLVDQFLFSYS